MRNLLYIILIFSSLSSLGQYKIKSVDYNTPFYPGGSAGNPFGLGITLENQNLDYELFARVAGFNTGGFLNRSFYDSSSGFYDYDRKIVYQLPEGDSVLTRTWDFRNSGIGIQLGLRKDFILWSVPIYTSAHLGLFAQRYEYLLQYAYTVNSPDTSEIGILIDQDYTVRPPVGAFEDKGWAVLPQIGIETGIVFSAGHRLQIVPKIAFNLSSLRANGIRPDGVETTTAQILRATSIQFDGSAALQVSYLLGKHNKSKS